MTKTVIDFETYNKLRELAHDAVDDAIRKVFTTTDGETDRLVESALSFDDMRYLIEEGKMRGFNYRDWDRKDPYIPDFKWEYRYPCTVYADTKSKQWWVDIHNLSENHPCFYKLMTQLSNRITNVSPKAITCN